MPLSITDSHCHLLMLKGEQDPIPRAIEHANSLGVNRMLNISVETNEWNHLVSISEAHEEVFHSLGIHPCHIENQNIPDEETLEVFMSHPKMLAVGEAGLDYYWKKKEEIGTAQKDMFLLQMDWAKKYKKPLIIHNREATEDILTLVRSHYDCSVGGIFHCFVDDWSIARQVLDLGFHISFSGIVSFKNAPLIQEVAAKMPLDKMLVETDSPFLTPVPHRGKPNFPGYTRHVSEFIATLRNQSLEEVAEATTKNFNNLFGLKN